MSQIFPHHISIFKKIYITDIDFFIKLWWGKTWDMHKRSFQSLKRTFMRVSGLSLPYFDFKNQLLYNFFLSKYGGGRHETCTNVRFRPWNARFCMPQVFLPLFWLKKPIYKVIGFLNQIMEGEDLRHEWTCVSGPQTQVYACLRSYHTIDWLKKIYGKLFFFQSKYGGGRPETCINVRFRPWDAHLCISQVSPNHILIKKPIYLYIGFLSKNDGGRPETCITVWFRAWNARLCMSQVFPQYIFFIKNQLLFKFTFSIKVSWGKMWDIQKLVFQGPKRTFMHVSGLPPTYFDKKQITF